MKKKAAKKSFTEILKTHPLPGVRIGRDENGDGVVHLGRPGIFTRTVHLNSEPSTKDAAQEEIPALANLTAAEKLWLQGAEIWKEIQVAAFSERPDLEEKASSLFAQALEADPMMTDAMLGIHATCLGRRNEMLELMAANPERFGETRDRLQTRLHSVYFPLVFSAEPLETFDDLLRAQAKRLAVGGSFEEARNMLAGTEDCLLNDLSSIDILFHEGQNADAVVSIQAALGNEDLSIYHQDDLQLLQGIGFLRQGQTTIAIRLLEKVSEEGHLKPLRLFALYELANLAIRENAPDLARVHLEALTREEPRYRDASELLLSISKSPEGTASATADAFSELVGSFYSGEVADDPDLPDNQI